MSGRTRKAAEAPTDAVQDVCYANAALDEAWSLYYAKAANDPHSPRAEINKKLSDYYAKAAKDAVPSGNEAKAQNRNADFKNSINEVVDHATNTIKAFGARDNPKPHETYRKAAEEATKSAKHAKAARDKYNSGNYSKDSPRDTVLKVYYAEAARDAAWSSYYAEAAAKDEDQKNKANASKDADLTVHCAEAAKDAAESVRSAEAAKDPKWSLSTFKYTLKKIMEAELKMAKGFAVDVTLDPDTAHPNLILSRDRKQVKHGNNCKKLPDNERRCSFLYVLGQQKFSSGKFYFEIQVEGKIEWDVGVVKESVNRKQLLIKGHDGCWMIWLRRKGENVIAASDEVLHYHPIPKKVGVFVDYEGGLVSFYDVDTADLIYCYTQCKFQNQTLLPCISPWVNYGGTNSAPLIICPVNR